MVHKTLKTHYEVVKQLDRQFFDNGNEGLEAIKVRSGRFIGCFHNVISIFRLIPEVKTSEWHRINYGQNGNRWISKAKS